MNLIPVDLDSIRIGQPLPFHLVDKDGVLLAKKSFVIRSRKDLEDISTRGELFIDGVDAEALRRAYIDQLQTMLRENRALGEIAQTKLSSEAIRGRTPAESEYLDWLDLQEQVNYLLRDSHIKTFQDRLEQINATLELQTHRNPDSALFALMQLAASETQMYSATHCLLVSVMCALAAREVLHWPAPIEDLLRKAALTMNIGMTELQDRLATQNEPLSPQQRAQVDGHARKSVDMLRAMEISDPTWLGAVLEHHSQTPGPLRAKTPAQRLARLIQRADLFAARLAPRASRKPITPAAAMQACYFDEDKQVDEAGAALIKAVGIYQPGTFVRLANEEIAVVIQRGANTNMPRVAVVINRSGLPTVEPMIRDTSQRGYQVVASVPHREVKVTINLIKMLPLTMQGGADRPW